MSHCRNMKFKENRLHSNPVVTPATTIIANEWVFDQKKYSN